MTVLGILGWAVIGAAIGYHAAPRRRFSRASGVVSGAPWGAFAVVLYFLIGSTSLIDHRQLSVIVRRDGSIETDPDATGMP